MIIQLSQPLSFCQLGARENQEDARFPDDDRPDVKTPCFLVCDGVGGNEAGEVASQTVCQTFGRAMEQYDSHGNALTLDNFSQMLDAAYDELDRIAEQHPQCTGMGTTLTFVCFGTRGVIAAHMGDSRIYHVRPGAGILYRSNDHSLVNAMVHAGQLTPEEAIDHPDANIITRCMCPTSADQLRSCASVVEITDVEPGDYFILCSDGVLHEVSDEMLAELLESDRTNDEKIRLLADTCKFSVDNNTLTMLQVKSVEGREEGAEPEASNPTVTRHISVRETPHITEVESIKNRTQSFIGRLWNRIFN